MDQNADGTSDENPLTTPFTGLTPGDAYMAPMPQTSVPFTFNGTNFFNPPFNQNSLPLIMPGPTWCRPRCPTAPAAITWSLTAPSARST